MNSVQLLGNLGQTPELRHVNSGKPVLNFSLAVDSRRTSNGRTMSDMNWFDVTVWGASAEHHARYLTKGSKVIVEGELNTRHYTDRDGIKRQKVEITAKEITWIDLKDRESEDNDQAETASA